MENGEDFKLPNQKLHLSLSVGFFEDIGLQQSDFLNKGVLSFFNPHFILQFKTLRTMSNLSVGYSAYFYQNF